MDRVMAHVEVEWVKVRAYRSYDTMRVTSKIFGSEHTAKEERLQR